MVQETCEERGCQRQRPSSESSDGNVILYDNLNVISPYQTAALAALMQRTGYSMSQCNGQRCYGGPPGWTGPAPGKGCEVFVGKLPRDCFEDEIVPIFEKAGKIYEVRMMLEFAGTNRGYCFVTYTNRNDAKRAVRDLDRHEIRKNKFLGVNFSVDNCRLYVGSIPHEKTQPEILAEMRRTTDGVVDVITYPSSVDKSKNRGFAFIEYESHRAAALARKKDVPGRLEMWGKMVIIDWAVPESLVDDDVMSKVRNLYVRNLMPTTTEDTLKLVFQYAAGEVGCIERVKIIKDFAFIHFNERKHALKAMNMLNGQNVEGAILEVTLAKPAATTRTPACCSQHGRVLEKTHDRCCPSSKSSSKSSKKTPHTHSVVKQAPTSTSCGCDVNDGGKQAGRAINGGGKQAGRDVNGGGKPAGSQLLEITSDMVLELTAEPVELPERTASQLLEDVCRRNSWGKPTFQLLSAKNPVTNTKLYVYKVSLNFMSCLFHLGFFIICMITN